MSIEKIQLGTTKKFTWISSGDTPSAIHVAIYTGSETLVSSVTGTSSGNGHDDANVSLTEANSYIGDGYYTFAWNATMNSNPYLNKGKFKLVLQEVE